MMSAKAMARANEDVEKMVAAGELEPLLHPEPAVTDVLLMREVADLVIGGADAHGVEDGLQWGGMAAQTQLSREGLKKEEYEGTARQEVLRRAWTLFALGVLLGARPDVREQAQAEAARLLGYHFD